ncbi:Tetratricopeptide-like helical [Ophiocordyceps sinensis CO18]|uniref:Tetratricopeptide-like helical n=1 Tax=Ophiocordyceps sinensis (strain Co18 / CGMCC 3.14243) TaxID=911162 RepID=T5A1A4_OPHSC|nr:Tetratricopeptide-like helical [Ophiocordyceps sinensis CO18]
MDIKTLVENGRGCYTAHKYERALKQFTRALGLCPCNLGKKRKRCDCKDYEAVAARDGSVFDEVMKSCQCNVGESFGKCHDPLHLMALDYRAATFEAMGELPRAERDAKWMLELAPLQPDGYLRLGKIARLRRKNSFAWKVYSAGVVAPLSSSPKLPKLRQALRQLQIHFRRRDPMWLPLELVHLIFAHFDVVDLSRKYIRVSKLWKITLESHDSRILWRVLIFPKPPPRPPSEPALSALVERSGGSVRKIVIRDPAGFALCRKKFSILLRHSGSLQHLELGPPLESYYYFPKGPDLFQNLCYLSMDTYNCNMWLSQDPRPPGAGFRPDEFLRHVAGTLEYLDLFGIPAAWYSVAPAVPEFPRLKVLHLEHKKGLTAQLSFPVFYLASKTPQLEQLALKNVHLESEGWRGWKPLWDTLWRHLRGFAFEMPKTAASSTQCDGTILNVSLINSLHVGKNFEYLDLLVNVANDDDAGAVQRIFSDADDLGRYGLTEADGSPIRRHDQFQNLQSLRLKGFVHSPWRMQNIFEAAVANGKLHTFDIVFPLDDRSRPSGEVSTTFLEGYDWLRGLDTIRCMGLSNFSFAPFPQHDAERPLPAFLASFPNLKTLSLSSNQMGPVECFSLMEEVVTRRSINILYQNCVQGTLMDRLPRVGES